MSEMSVSKTTALIETLVHSVAQIIKDNDLAVGTRVSEQLSTLLLLVKNFLVEEIPCEWIVRSMEYELC